MLAEFEMVAMEGDRREHHVSIVLQGRDRLSRRRTLLDSDLIEERGGEIVVRYGLALADRIREVIIECGEVAGAKRPRMTPSTGSFVSPSYVSPG